MLQIVIESQEIEVGKDNGLVSADYFVEDGWLTCAVDLRDYNGPLATWVKEGSVVLCWPEEISRIFQADSAPGFGSRVLDWERYCSYVNNNVAK